jgi:hypothetical protein
MLLYAQRPSIQNSYAANWPDDKGLYRLIQANVESLAAL